MAAVTDDGEILEAIHASKGFGPLLQRNYRAIIEGTEASPENLIELIKTRFEAFAPERTACFTRVDGSSGPLDLGREMNICIRLVGGCRVRVVHMDRLSLTLRTLAGHPEAGRITFASGRDEQGRLLLQIRSRTRASGLVSYFGFLFLGKQMQAKTWIRYLWNVAEAAGGRVRGSVNVRTIKVVEREADGEGHDDPTVASRGAG